jgi:hypothetical protein
LAVGFWLLAFGFWREQDQKQHKPAAARKAALEKA